MNCYLLLYVTSLKVTSYKYCWCAKSTSLLVIFDSYTKIQLWQDYDGKANLALNLELVTGEDSRKVPELGDADDGNGLEGEDHLVGDRILFPERRLVLQVAEGGVVV